MKIGKWLPLIILATVMVIAFAAIACQPQETPTPPPTPKPTAAPTAAPTAKPTTPAPTAAPTAKPTTAPTAAPTSAPTATAKPSGGPRPIPANHAGRTGCAMCHATGVAGPKFPASPDHTAFAEAMCASCHTGAAAAPTAAATTAPTAAPTSAATTAPVATAKPSSGPPALPANHAGRTTCAMCHSTGLAGAPKYPAAPDHAGFADGMCSGCHKPA